MRWYACGTPPRRWRSTGVRRRNACSCGGGSTPIVSNYKHYINRMMGFNGWNLSISQTIVLLPWLLQAPRLFSQQIKLGDVTQSASAFSSVQNGLSFFRNQYDSFAGWRASIIRLHGLVVSNEEGRALPKLDVTDSRECLVEFDDVEVRTPDGQQLIKPLDLRLNQGDTLIVTGESGSGKTTLLRSAGPAVALHQRHLPLPRRPRRDDVPVADAVCPAG